MEYEGIGNPLGKRNINGKLIDMKFVGIKERASTIEEFVDTFYKPDRLNNCEGLREAIINSARKDLGIWGYTMCTHHSSVTGRCVYFSPKFINEV